MLWSMNLARASALPLAVVLVGSLALGCGAEEDEPAEVSTQQRYCDAYRDFFDERADQGSNASDTEVVATLKEWGRQSTEIGIPDDMGEEARAGHDIWSDLIAQVDDDADRAEVEALEAGLSRKQLGMVEEFFAYNDGTCLGSSARTGAAG